ncbi:MAG: response regulator [Coriobacteriales bacterium]|jgi:signal transduction histidine kinase/CheY-like chemotaxis protein|nr:response regulator [Coriobacteriales bacterium]
MKKIIRLLRRYLFSTKIPQEGRIFNATMLLCVAGAVLGSVVTLMELSSILSAILTLALGAAIVAFTVICNKTHRYDDGNLFFSLVVGVFIFPILFFVSGGIYSGMLAYFILGAAAMSVLLKGIRFFIVISLYILVCLCCYLTSFFFPELVTPIVSESLIYLDVCLSFIVSSAMVIFTIKNQNGQFIRSQKALEVERLRADAASAAKSDFLSNMSHEMRTPMNAIIGMATVGLAAEDLKAKNRSLEQVGLASKHLLAIINDILDMSKIEAGKLELSPAPFSFTAMIASVTNVISLKAEERNQDFVVEIDPQIPAALVGDGQRLAQVLTNLLSNAVKFTPEKGRIALRIAVENPGATGSDARPALDTKAAQSPQAQTSERSSDRAPDPSFDIRLRFEVQDNGIGITAEQQSTLFKAFTQADSSISRKYGGTGLGLVISKRIVELMNGQIWVQSQPEAGSTFGFTAELKIASAAQSADIETSDTNNVVATSAQALQEDELDLSAYTLLLAEDVEINQEIVLALLESTGLKIVTALNGSEALEAFSSQPERYDMILMDIQMPEMDGLEATRRIRALAKTVPRAATIPIVAMTANVFREDVEKSLEAGMNGHLGKPIDLGELLSALKKHLLGQ